MLTWTELHWIRNSYFALTVPLFVCFNQRDCSFKISTGFLGPDSSLLQMVTKTTYENETPNNNTKTSWGKSSYCQSLEGTFITRMNHLWISAFYLSASATTNTNINS